jgi:D-alanyl-D-alanine carboxypeptidase
MRMQFHKLVAIALALLLSFAFVGCSKNSKNPLESKPAISADVPVEDVENNEDKQSKPDVQEDPKPVYIGVEKITLSKYSVTVVEGSSDMPIVTMHPTNATNKNEVWSSDNTAIATVNNIGRITGVSVGNCKVTVHSEDNPNVFAEVSVTVTPYIAPIEPEITYINGILIANKTYPLPSTYNPGVDPVANAALQELFAAAKLDGINLFVKSGFRSYSTQKTLYNKYVKRDGAAAADRYSARPGHSEHQTGLAFDINKADSSFEGSAEAVWLAENCYKYGFIIRYPKGKEAITGYIYEPWHIRYLGVETATAVYNSGLCLEEYLGITSSYQ